MCNLVDVSPCLAFLCDPRATPRLHGLPANPSSLIVVSPSSILAVDAALRIDAIESIRERFSDIIDAIP